MIKYLFILIFFTSATFAQSDSQVKDSTGMKTFNIEKYKSMPLDKRYNSSNVQGNAHYKNGNNLLRIVTTAGRISVRKSFEDTPYQTLEIYNEKTKLLIEEGKLFSSVQYGTWKKYDEKGNLIEEVNHDKRFKFSIDDLIGKMQNEHGKDITIKSLASIRRYYKEEYDISFYSLIVRHFPGASQHHSYIIDGNTGETLLHAGRSREDGLESVLNTFLETLKRK